MREGHTAVIGRYQSRMPRAEEAQMQDGYSSDVSIQLSMAQPIRLHWR
jgi:hypothetical protein